MQTFLLGFFYKAIILIKQIYPYLFICSRGINKSVYCLIISTNSFFDKPLPMATSLEPILIIIGPPNAALWTTFIVELSSIDRELNFCLAPHPSGSFVTFRISPSFASLNVVLIPSFNNYLNNRHFIRIHRFVKAFSI